MNRLIKTILLSVVLAGAVGLGAPGGVQAAPAQRTAAIAPEAVPANSDAEGEEHGVPQKAVEIGGPAKFPITNSMLVSWIVALGLIIFARVAMRDAKEIPSGAQNFWEWMVESLHDFLEGIIGHKLVQKTFWFFATVFIFILFCNWLSLVPGVGTVGWGHKTEHAFRVTEPFFRGANADLNMTLAMSLVFFVCWTVWALQAHGPIGFLTHLFAPKGETTEIGRAHV